MTDRKGFIKSIVALTAYPVAAKSNDKFLVYELRECDEYFMQTSRGLYHTPHRALESISEEIIRVDEIGSYWIILALNPDHYDQPIKHVIEAAKSLSTSDFYRTLDGFGFYNWTHHGFNVLGIHPRNVEI